MIIGVISQKGGVGKTTISINLAACFAKAGARTLLVDGDPQCSSLMWSSCRDIKPIFPVIGMAKPTIHKDLPEIATDYDVVIIDGAPRVNELGRGAILASDLIIIPVQPSPLDVWATDETVKLIQEAQIFKENIKAVFVINRKIVNSAIGRDVVGVFKNHPFPVLKKSLSQRVIFAESMAQGLAVIEAAKTSDGAKEIGELARVLIEREGILNGN